MVKKLLPLVFFVLLFALTAAGQTEHGRISVSDRLIFFESAGDATCAVGDYWVKGNSSTTTLRGCENGNLFDVNTTAGAASWSSLTNPTAVTTFTSDAVAEIMSYDFQANYTTEQLILFKTSVGTPSGGTLLTLEVHDADVLPFAISDGSSNVFTVARTGNVRFTAISPPSYSAGNLFYDSSNESLTFHNNESDIALQVGQEEWVRVRNETGSTVNNGQVVYIDGIASGLPRIALAKADAAATAEAVGLATHSIEDMTNGYVTVLGLVRNFNTSAFTIGDRLFLSPTTAGALTATAPSDPNFSVPIGIVTEVDVSTGDVLVTLGPPRPRGDTGIAVVGGDLRTASTEEGFLNSGALTCGASTAGSMRVHTTPLQYCDNAATPLLQYAAYGASDGDALAGDSATSFFDAGTLEDTRLSANVALATDTLDFFAATTSAEFLGIISNETGTTGLVVASINPTLTDVTVDDLITFTETAGDAACAAGDYWVKGNSTSNKMRGCENGTAFDLNTAGGGNSFGTIGNAVADTGADTLTVTDSGRIDFTTTDAPEDLTADIVANSVDATYIDETDAYAFSSTTNTFVGASYTDGSGAAAGAGVLRCANNVACVAAEAAPAAADGTILYNASEEWVFNSPISVSSGGTDQVQLGSGTNLSTWQHTYIEFEGATDDGFEARFNITDPTADRFVTVPNADTTIHQPFSCTNQFARSSATATGLVTCETVVAADKDLTEAQTWTGLHTFVPSGLGGLANFDIQIGDTDGSPTYGIARFGNSFGGRTSFISGSLDLDGAVLWVNQGGPVTSDIEFAWMESSSVIRFAIAGAGAGLGTYSPRSLIVAGPAPANSNMVTCDTWTTDNANIDCDTSTTGADLFVQDDAEIEGTVFAGVLTEGGNAVPNSTDTLDFFAATTSAEFLGMISNETGTTGLVVASINPTLTDVTIDDLITFTETAGDATCAGGDYWIKGNSSTNTMRGCENGTAFDVNTTAGAASWSSLTDPTAAVTMNSGAVAELLQFNYTAAYGATDVLFQIEQLTGDTAAGSILLELVAADTDILLLSAGSGANTIDITQAGAMTAEGTATITATDLAAGAVDATTELAAGLCGANTILERQAAVWACIATPSGGGARWDELTDPTAAMGFTSSTVTELMDWDFQANYTVELLFDVRTTTGTPSGGVLANFQVHDADVTIFRAWDGTNGVEVSGAGVLGALSTGGVDWAALLNYPTGCTNQFVVTIADTLTCDTVTAADTDETTFTGVTWGANADFVWNFDTVGGANPDSVISFTGADVNISTGVLQEGGVNVVVDSFTITTGDGLTGGGDLTTNRTFAIDLNETVDGVGSSSNLSGMEFTATGELALLQDCATGQILKYTTTGDLWECQNDDDSGGAPRWDQLTDPTAVMSMTSSSNTELLSFNYTSALGATDVALQIEQLTGDPVTGSILLELTAADADILLLSADGFTIDSVGAAAGPSFTGTGSNGVIEFPNSAAANAGANVGRLRYDSASQDLQLSRNTGGYVALVVESRLLTGGNGIATLGDLSADRTVAIDLLTADDQTGSSSNQSGLEFGDTGSDKLGLLRACGNGQILKFNTTGGLWACQNDDDSGGSPAWEALVNTADTATAYTSSADAETLTFDFQSNFSTDRFIIQDSTGTPTAGTLLQITVTDADVEGLRVEKNNADEGSFFNISNSNTASRAFMRVISDTAQGGIAAYGSTHATAADETWFWSAGASGKLLIRQDGAKPIEFWTNGSEQGAISSAGAWTIGGSLEAGTLTESSNAVPNSTDNLGFFAATTSLQFIGVISDPTGTGLSVFNDTPTIITPSFTTGFTIGGAAATDDCVLGNATNFVASSTCALSSDTLGFFSSTTSAQLATVLSNETGTGVAVFSAPTAFTLDVETGTNAITTVSKIYIDAASCIGATATNNWDDAGTGDTAPTAACNDTGSIQRPSADFAGGAVNTFERTIRLPSDWASAENVDVSIRHVAVAASPTGNVEWDISTVCRAAGETWDGTFNAIQTITDAVAAQNTLNDADQASVTMTTCAADEDWSLKISRDGVNDTNNDLAKMMGVMITLRRAQ